MLLKILVDLDVITVALWDKNEEALKFLERIKRGEFEVYVPYTLLDLVSGWSYVDLRGKIRHFYEVYGKKIITAQNIANRISKLKANDKRIIEEFKKEDVKKEDIVLVIIVSIFGLDCLVTYNRKHLKNKKEIINEVLKKNGFKTIEIVLPSEI